MTDRELLELAAKAAGYIVRWHDIWKCFVHVGPHNIDSPPTPAGDRHVWAPLDDDGDAFRLMVALSLDVVFSGSRREVCANYTGARGRLREVEQLVFDEPAADVRRVIVMAAAELGAEK